MKVLFVGGTGLISSACTRLAIAQGIDLFLLNRGNRPDQPADATTLLADIRDLEATARVLAGHHFDAVVDWIAYTPDDVERDLLLFRDITHQYVFISSASAYQRPVSHYRITEDTPLANPYWAYSRNKITCEERLMRAYREDGFPFTVVRPSLTYGDTQIPLVMNSWQRPYTAVARMRQGKPLIVPGDGTSLWTITHNTDFARGLVGLLGHQQAIGHAFHVTSDEVMTWDQFYAAVAAAAGVEANIVHIASDFIAVCMPDLKGSLLGDKVTAWCSTTARSSALFPASAPRRRSRAVSGRRWPGLRLTQPGSRSTPSSTNNGIG